MEKEQLLRSSFSASEYQKLLAFFQDIWLSDAFYKVIIARRAFNLNAVFMDIADAQSMDKYKTENIMSNTALLLCAEEIAEYYHAKAAIPSILLVDDLLIHGRGIMKLIDNLERLILTFLNKNHACSESEEVIHKKLMDALCVYVYACNCNAQGILLDKNFSLKEVTQLSIGELRVLSQQISRALQQSVIANTSYVLSAELPQDFGENDFINDGGVNEDSLFQYRGNFLRYYYRNTERKILETIRIYCFNKNNLLDRTVTSLVIFGDISYRPGDEDSPFYLLCKDMADEIRKINSKSRMAEILSYEEEFLAQARVQMISYLLSILSYADFCREKISSAPSFLYKALCRSDYKKIASNFGRPKQIETEITEFFRYISDREDLRGGIFKKLLGYTEHFNRDPEPIKNSDPINDMETGDHFQIGRWLRNSGIYENSESIHEIAEDIFYEVGMNAEYDANKYACSYEKFDPSRPRNNFIRFKQYLHIMDYSGVQGISSVGCVLNLMDSGLLAMNLIHDSAQGQMQCILKAGELSTFVLPRRFSVLIPALSIVEREYSKKGTSKKQTVSKFIDYLQDHCYQRNGRTSRESASLLSKLKRSKASLLYLYMAGQSFQDWDVNLFTSEDRFPYGLDEKGVFDPEKYISYILEKEHQMEYYNYCAREFLRSE